MVRFLPQFKIVGRSFWGICWILFSYWILLIVVRQLFAMFVRERENSLNFSNIWGPDQKKTGRYFRKCKYFIQQIFQLCIHNLIARHSYQIHNCDNQTILKKLKNNILHTILNSQTKHLRVNFQMNRSPEWHHKIATIKLDSSFVRSFEWMMIFFWTCQWKVVVIKKRLLTSSTLPNKMLICFFSYGNYSFMWSIGVKSGQVEIILPIQTGLNHNHNILGLFR